MTGQRGQHGGIAKGNRKFINLVVWILRTGTLWLDLPSDYGKWETVHQKFIRWQINIIWKKLFEIFKGNKKFEWSMIDRFNLCKRLSAFIRWSWRELSYIKDKRGINLKIHKIHLFANEYSMPINLIVTNGTRSDWKKTTHLIENTDAKLLLAAHV